jgi:hypothetical protein
MEAQVQNAVEVALNPQAEYTLKQQARTLQTHPASPLTAGSRVYRPGEGFPGCVESRLIASHKSAIAVCPYIRGQLLTDKASPGPPFCTPNT